jgi:DNA adenine methylase
VLITDGRKCAESRLGSGVNMNTFLRWAGSKKQILTHLHSRRPARFKRYIEPFCGSARFYFDLEPGTAILGDLNSELISTYEAVKNDVSAVIKKLRSLPSGKDSYYDIRRINPETLSSSELAARFIYLNFYCFNGLYRTNLHGQFNVPFGRRKNDKPIDENQIIACARMLKGARLLSLDFEDTLEYAKSGDFIYLDPPFAISSRRMFREYIPNAFTGCDLERLRKALYRLNKKGVLFLISYADSREARRLLSRWNPIRIRTRRNIAGFAGSRRFAYELLAANY